MNLAKAVTKVERCAATNESPQVIAAWVRKFDSDGFESDGLVAALESRIAALAEAAGTRPDHAKLNRGLDVMRAVAALLTPAGVEAELAELANQIRVCVEKADNYATTAGQHLRQARDRCRAIGLDFNKWCAQANLGIKRSRIYQLMGPDPITAERRGKNHTEEAENVQPVDIEQTTNVEQPAPPDPVHPPAGLSGGPRSPGLTVIADADADDPSNDERAVLELKRLWMTTSLEARETFLRWIDEQGARHPQRGSPAAQPGTAA